MLQTLFGGVHVLEQQLIRDHERFRFGIESIVDRVFIDVLAGVERALSQTQQVADRVVVFSFVESTKSG